MKHRKINASELINVNDLQDMGFTRTMAYNILNRRDVPVIRIGNRKFIRREKFEEWLEKQEENTEDE
ncbi:MAG: helix-turn-helix domain-containing protein [Ruminococcus sp.]|nr:helix-turn-helix domain-containing protein [Ruminococcus sp.]